MIRTTHATLKMLRAGRAETITVRAHVTGRCPLTPERTYTLYAPADDDHRKEKLRCLATDAIRNDGEWHVTFRSGIGVEQVRYLAARPGSSGDYTTVEARAAQDEPEPVDQLALRRFEKDARTTEQIRDDWHRQATIRDIEAAIVRLEERGDDQDRVALQKLRAARRELLKAA